MEEGQGGRGGRAAGLGWAGGDHGAGWWAWWLAGGHGGWWLAARWHGGMAQDVVIGFDIHIHVNRIVAMDARKLLKGGVLANEGV